MDNLDNLDLKWIILGFFIYVVSNLPDRIPICEISLKSNRNLPKSFPWGKYEMLHCL